MLKCVTRNDSYYSMEITNMGAGIVAQQLKPPPAMLACQVGTSSSPSQLPADDANDLGKVAEAEPSQWTPAPV